MQQFNQAKTFMYLQSFNYLAIPQGEKTQLSTLLFTKWFVYYHLDISSNSPKSSKIFQIYCCIYLYRLFIRKIIQSDKYILEALRNLLPSYLALLFFPHFSWLSTILLLE